MGSGGGDGVGGGVVVAAPVVVAAVGMLAFDIVQIFEAKAMRQISDFN